MKNTLQGKGRIPSRITIYCISLFRCRKQWRFQMQRQQWTRSGKAWDHPSMGCEKKSEQKGGHKRGTEKQQWSSFCFIDGLLSSKEFGVGANSRSTKEELCFERRHCERRVWSLCSIYWTGLTSVTSDGRKSNGCYCSTARLRRTTSWRNIGGHPSENGGCSKLLKIPKSECPDIWIRLPKHKWPKSWEYIEDLVVPLERNY